MTENATGKAWKNLSGEWKFVSLVAMIAVAAGLINPGFLWISWLFFLRFTGSLLPLLGLIFILMMAFNIFFSPEFIKTRVTESKYRYLYATLGGIISSGPIYLWYPLLSDLREKGITDGLIATFLYNRSVKIPLLPIMAWYFSWQLIITLLLVTIIMGVLNGIFMQLLMRKS